MDARGRKAESTLATVVEAFCVWVSVTGWYDKKNMSCAVNYATFQRRGTASIEVLCVETASSLRPSIHMLSVRTVQDFFCSARAVTRSKLVRYARSDGRLACCTITKRQDHSYWTSGCSPCCPGPTWASVQCPRFPCHAQHHPSFHRLPGCPSHVPSQPSDC